MDHPFFPQHLSQIHEAETLYDSQFSSLREGDQQNWFHQQRSYMKSVLNSWGLTVGELPYSRDNEATLRCLIELVGYRQKEFQFRNRTKEEMGSLQFEKEKYRSFLQQSQRKVQEHAKRIGSLENELSSVKTKEKKNEGQVKKEREDDRKMIVMLRNKNEQVLHEIKKKQQETNRIKEQMKKNVGEKNPSKNSFQIFQTLNNRTPNKQRQLVDDKYTFLMQRNQRELSLAIKENAILRQKLFEIRESLLQFNIWVDQQIFGEDVDPSQIPRIYTHKFYLNHNLLFKKESLTDEFDQLLEVTKDGLLQLREIFRGNRSPPKIADGLKQDIVELNFKKKSSQQRQPKTERIIKNNESRNDNKVNIRKMEPMNSQNHTPKSKKPSYQMHSEVNIKHSENNIASVDPKKICNIVTRELPKKIISHKSLKEVYRDQNKDILFEDDLLSEVNENHDSSIISHISIEQMGKSRFDKWDILYQEEE